MEDNPQIVLVTTARVQRLMWKYEGLGYAMILKNAGVLTGLMYLVATAMGLAPCALGAGDSAAFAAMSGLDPLVEPAVADFLLGSRRPEDR
jgi:SagB-type dehydrogenase family enzyme